MLSSGFYINNRFSSQASVCSTVDGVSLCHLEHKIDRVEPTLIEDACIHIGKTCGSNTDNYYLPNGKTN
jgi:hypothetical protein